MFWESDCGMYGVINGSTSRDIWRVFPLDPLLYYLDCTTSWHIFHLYLEYHCTKSPSGMGIPQPTFLSSTIITSQFWSYRQSTLSQQIPSISWIHVIAVGSFLVI